MGHRQEVHGCGYERDMGKVQLAEGQSSRDARHARHPRHEQPGGNVDDASHCAAHQACGQPRGQPPHHHGAGGGHGEEVGGHRHHRQASEDGHEDGRDADLRRQRHREGRAQRPRAGQRGGEGAGEQRDAGARADRQEEADRAHE